MAPNTAIEDAKAAIKRKRELDDHGKSKRTKRDKLKAKDGPNRENADVDSSIIDAGVEDDAQDKTPSSTKKDKRITKKSVKDLQDGGSRQSAWKLSQAMGGRMLDIDPILTADDQHLILAYHTSVQVYSAAESLLLRKISLQMSTKTAIPENIVATSLSPTSPNHIWVASSAGRMWLVDWTTGEGADLPIQINCSLVTSLAVEAVTIRGQIRDVPFVSVLVGETWQIWACDFQGRKLAGRKILVTRAEFIENLRSVDGGKALVASSRRDILLGSLRPETAKSVSDLVYEFFILDCSDDITCLDIRGAERIHLNRKSQVQAGDDIVVDVVIGCARGAIFFYNDLLPQLRFLEKSGGRNYSLQPRKYHWHRKAVHAVKWSQDGNYIISGGSESVLVQWQLDTGKVDVLPHLGATIENIVVSARGSSYTIHLDDNSTMIMTTAEMKPITYISGIQTLITPPPPSKDSVVKRIGQTQEQGLISKIPSAINPKDHTRLVLCVGNGQQSAQSSGTASMPLLQTLDLSTVQGVSKQAMTRTHPTDVNTTFKGHPITEPRVTHMAYSHDGKWLATVDEWQPPTRDMEPLERPSSDRREVYLKFWTSASEEDSTLELVSRINGPHYTGHDERMLDLVADPTSHRFATLGEDGVVRIWQSGVRQRDGIVVKSRTGRGMESWACVQSIHLQENKALADQQVVSSYSPLRRSGALSYSEDGSMLACAFQNGDESTVYVVDATSGKVVDALDGLINGEVQSIRVLSSQLIVLSDVLVVYNIVTDEMSYGIDLDQEGSAAVIPHLSQLAVDYSSQSYALVVSRINSKGVLKSELAVFSAEHCEPEMIYQIPQPVVAVMTAPGTSGYLVLDSAAQLWSLSQSTDMQSVVLAQPLADINLDTGVAAKDDHAAVVALVNQNEDDEAASDDEMELDGPEDVEMDEDDSHPVVVAPQKLAELFDAAPSFAMPPIEDMFYQVTKLFSPRPTAVGTN
ncbi:hypothetical protein BX600DRAFT_505791 [Xylariales sp. PMI_506]|nr:hypothetical protein BX600DRAFT_505791 [Xylariales sp. PMI_506]